MQVQYSRKEWSEALTAALYLSRFHARRYQIRKCEGYWIVVRAIK